MWSWEIFIRRRKCLRRNISRNWICPNLLGLVLVFSWRKAPLILFKHQRKLLRRVMSSLLILLSLTLSMMLKKGDKKLLLFSSLIPSLWRKLVTQSWLELFQRSWATFHIPLMMRKNKIRRNPESIFHNVIVFYNSGSNIIEGGRRRRRNETAHQKLKSQKERNDHQKLLKNKKL